MIHSMVIIKVIYISFNYFLEVVCVIEEVKGHCEHLGLECGEISEVDGRYLSGSCLPYREVSFDISGYSLNLKDMPWGGY